MKWLFSKYLTHRNYFKDIFINSIYLPFVNGLFLAVLKIIKSRLRSTIPQDLLDNLGLILIESDLTSFLNSDDIL